MRLQRYGWKVTAGKLAFTALAYSRIIDKKAPNIFFMVENREADIESIHPFFLVMGG